MTRLSFYGTFLLALGIAAVPACSASESDTGDVGGTGGGGQGCTPGLQSVCPCPGGGSGVQVCKEDGSGFDTCQCDPTGGSGGGVDDPCGDYHCDTDAGEDCHTCAQDCGICAPCDIAPACDNVTLPPTDVPHFSDLDVTLEAVPAAALRERVGELIRSGAPALRIIAAGLNPVPQPDEHPFITQLRELFDANPEGAAAVRRQLALAGMDSVEQYRAAFPVQQYKPPTLMDVVPGGTLECGAPFLRFALTQITSHEEYDDLTNDVIYCVIVSEPTSGGGEIIVTPPTQSLDEGESFTGFSMTNSVFWGQTPQAGCEEDVFVCGPRTPGGDLLITYDCLEQDDPTAYVNLINGIGAAAGTIGGFIPGTAGWILLGIGAVAPIVSGLIGADGDDYLFHAQQTVLLEDQMELTNGWYYTVRKSGTAGTIPSDWDWELFVKVWGCAEYGEL